MIGLKTKHAECRITFKSFKSVTCYVFFSELKRKNIHSYKFLKFVNHRRSEVTGFEMHDLLEKFSFTKSSSKLKKNQRHGELARSSVNQH